VNKGYGLYWIADEIDTTVTDTGATIPADTNDAVQKVNNTNDTNNIKNTETVKKVKRLIRYDAKDADFVAMNELLWSIAELNEEDYSDSHSLQDFLALQGRESRENGGLIVTESSRFSEAMIAMAGGGFANTLCTNSRDLSLKQCIKWCRMWHEEVRFYYYYIYHSSFDVYIYCSGVRYSIYAFLYSFIRIYSYIGRRRRRLFI